MKIHLTWTQSKVLLFSFHRPDVAHHQLELISEEVLEFAGPRDDLIQASKGATREVCSLPLACNCLRCRLLSPTPPSQGRAPAIPPQPSLPTPMYHLAGRQLKSADLVPAQKWEGIANKHNSVLGKSGASFLLCVCLTYPHPYTGQGGSHLLSLPFCGFWTF